MSVRPPVRPTPPVFVNRHIVIKRVTRRYIDYHFFPQNISNLNPADESYNIINIVCGIPEYIILILYIHA